MFRDVNVNHLQDFDAQIFWGMLVQNLDILIFKEISMQNYLWDSDALTLRDADTKLSARFWCVDLQKDVGTKSTLLGPNSVHFGIKTLSVSDINKHDTDFWHINSLSSYRNIRRKYTTAA